MPRAYWPTFPRLSLANFRPAPLWQYPDSYVWAHSFFFHVETFRTACKIDDIELTPTIFPRFEPFLLVQFCSKIGIFGSRHNFRHVQFRFQDGFVLSLVLYRLCVS